MWGTLHYNSLLRKIPASLNWLWTVWSNILHSSGICVTMVVAFWVAVITLCWPDLGLPLTLWVVLHCAHKAEMVHLDMLQCPACNYVELTLILALLRYLQCQYSVCLNHCWCGLLCTTNRGFGMQSYRTSWCSITCVLVRPTHWNVYSCIIIMWLTSVFSNIYWSTSKREETEGRKDNSTWTMYSWSSSPFKRYFPVFNY